MWNQQHRQYNVDRLELIDELYSQLDGQVSKETLSIVVCDYEALIIEYLTRTGAIDVQWIIPNIVYLFNATGRKKRKKKIKKANVIQMFLEQKLFDFL